MMNNEEHNNAPATTGDNPDETATSPTDQRRREMLRRLGKVAIYAAPVTMATLSMKASACSMTC